MNTGKVSKLILMLGLMAGVSYFLLSAVTIDPVLRVIWKGAGVALLALYAACLARDIDGWLIVFVMIASSVGDMLIEAVGLQTGAVAFIVSHAVAAVLYLRNRRLHPTKSQALLALCVIPFGVSISYLLTGDGWIATYTVTVAAMTALAWLSRFPRYRTGIGAFMFLTSDLLIFAQIGPLAGTQWTGFVIWGLYFGGQLLIVLGVTPTLAQARR